MHALEVSPPSLLCRRRGRDSAANVVGVGGKTEAERALGLYGRGRTRLQSGGYLREPSKRRAPMGAVVPQEAAQKTQHPLKPYPGLCSGVSPQAPAPAVAGRQLCQQVGYRFSNSKHCLSAFFLGASAL